MDNNKLEVGFDAPGVDLIHKAIGALDKLQSVMAGLGTGPAASGLKTIQNQVAEMQASMTTGFVEIESRLDKFSAKVKQASDASTSYAQQRLAASQAALAAERAAASETQKLAAQMAAAEASRNQLSSSYAQKRLAASQAALAADRASTKETVKLNEEAAAAEASRNQLTANYAQQRLATTQANLAAERAAERAARAESAKEAQTYWAQVTAAAKAGAELESTLAAQRSANASGYAAKRLAASQAALAADRSAASEAVRLNQTLAASEAERTRASVNYAQQRLAASQAALAAERSAATQAAALAKASADAEVSIHAQRTANANGYAANRLAQSQSNLAHRRAEAASEEAIARQAAAAEQAIQAERLANGRNYAQQRLAQSQAAIQAERAAAAEQLAATERQRVLNTGFLTASPQSQLRTVREAQTYSSLGGDASSKYGTNAANIAASTAEYKKLEQAAKASTGTIHHHNEAMREGHAFARGLSGALGTLWITYGSLAPLIAGAALAGSLRKVYEVGKEVEHQLAFVQALTGTPVNLDDFLKITEGTVVSIKDAANGMRALAQNGLDAQKSLEALPTILRLATIGEMDVSAAALSATGVLSAFNLQFSELGKVADIFAKVAASSNTSVSGMTESMKTASTAASMYGVTVEETAASLGVLARLNITGTAAGTAFRNALKDLYTPTNQQAKALKALNLETVEGNGKLKSYTVVMDELREKLSKLSEASRLDVLGQISSERGGKVIAEMVSNLSSYSTKMTEIAGATNFTAKAVLVLEDTTAGASRRMANAFDQTFVKAFKDAEPVIQKLLTELGDIGKSSGLMNFLSGAAEGVANLTGFIVEHAKAITYMVAAYAGLKGFGLLTSAYAASSAALGTNTVAAYANAQATRISAAVKAAYTPTVAATTTATVVDTAATVAATTATTAWARATTYLTGTLKLVQLSLGPVMIALTAAVTVYELFLNRTSESDKVLLKQSNSLKVISEDLDHQIAKLKKRNELWDPTTQTFKSENVASIKEASDVVSLRRKDVAKAESIANAAADTGATAFRLTLLQSELDSRRKLLKEALTEEFNIQKKIGEQTYREKLNQEHTLRADLFASLTKFRAKADETTMFGADGKLLDPKKTSGRLIHTEAQQEVFKKAEPLLGRFNAAKTMVELQEVKRDLVNLEELAKRTGAVASITSPDGDARRAATDRYQEQLNKVSSEAAKKVKEIEGDLARAKSAYSQGGLGDVEMINKEIDATKQLAQVKIDSAVRSAAIAAKEKDKSDVAKFTGQRSAAEEELAQAELTRQQRLVDQDRKNQREITKNRVEELRLRGSNEEAATLEATENYSTAIQKLKKDIASDLESGDINWAMFDNKAKLLQQMQDRFDAKIAEGVTQDFEAKAKDITDRIATINNNVAASISELNEKASAGVGVFDEWGIADLISKLKNDALPQIEKAHKEAQALQALAKKPKDQTITEKVLSETNKAAGGVTKKIDDLELKAAEGMFKSLAASIDGMGESSRRVADAFANMGTALAQFKRIQQDEREGNVVTTQTRIKAYSTMSTAAKGFFKENTEGYRTMANVEKIFRIAEITDAMSSFAVKSGLTTAFTSLFVASKATETSVDAASTGSSMANSAMRATADGVAGVAKAIASMPFPLNLAAGAATFGALMAIGVKMSGGVGNGSVDMTKQRQEEAGTGSVLGDSKVKSESLSKSFALTTKIMENQLSHTISMDNSLKAIANNMLGLTNQVIKSGGLDLAASGVSVGKTQQLGRFTTPAVTAAGTVGGMAAGAYYGMAAGSVGGPIGMAIGAIAGALLGSVLGKLTSVKTSLLDQGLTAPQQTLSSIQDKGLSAQSYADVNVVKKALGFTYSNKTSAVTENLPTEVTKQFSMVITSIADSVKIAAGVIGISGDEFNAKLGSFVVDLGKISTKGLSPEQIQKQFETVFSKMGDDMANSAVSGLINFQNAGEGAYETLVRIASGFLTVNDVLTSLNMKTVAIGMAGVKATDDLIKFSGGLDQLTQNAAYFAENFLSDAERLAPAQAALTERMKALGYGSVTTVEGFKNLVQGLDVTNSAQAQLYAELLKLAPTFKKVADAAAEAASSTSKVEEARQAVESAKAAYTSALQSVSSNLDQLRSRALAANQAEMAVKDKISTAYFSSLDAVAAAQAKITELNRQAADSMNSFAKTVRNFLSGLVGGTANTMDKRALEANLISTAGKAKGNDKDAQSQLVSLAQSFLEVSQNSSRTALDFLRDQAMVNALLGDVATSMEKQAKDLNVTPAKDPMVVAQEELLAAQEKLAKYSLLALATNSNMDRSLVVVADSVQNLLFEFKKAHEENLKAQAEAAAGEKLASGLNLPTKSALSNLIASIDEAAKANTTLLTAQGSLSDEIIKAATATTPTVTAFLNSLGLTGAQADLVKAALLQAELSTTGFANLMKDTNTSPTGLAAQLLLAGGSVTTLMDNLSKDPLSALRGNIAEKSGLTKESLDVLLANLKSNPTGNLESALTVEAGKVPTTLTKLFEALSTNPTDALKLALNASNANIPTVIDELIAKLGGDPTGELRSLLNKEALQMPAALKTLADNVSADPTGALKQIMENAKTPMSAALTSLKNAGVSVDEFKGIIASSGLSADAILKAFDSTDTGLQGIVKKTGGSLSTISASASAAGTTIDKFNEMLALNGLTEESFNGLKALTGGDAGLLAGYLTEAAKSGATLATTLSNLQSSADAMKQLMDSFKLPTVPATPTTGGTSGSGNTAPGTSTGTAPDSMNTQLVKSWYANNINAVKNPTADAIAYWAGDIAKNGLVAAKTAFANSVATTSGTTPLEITKFATGGIFDSGVVTRPTMFNMGEMGEAGPEMILPVTSIGGGYGVRAIGSSDSGTEDEVKALREDVKMLKYALDTNNATLKKIQQLLAYVTRDGRAMQTEVYDDGTTV